MLKDQLSVISSIPISASNSKQVSIDMSDMVHTSRAHEIKKVLLNRKEKDSKCIDESSIENSMAHNNHKKNKLAAHVSPKTTTLKAMLHSPRFSVAPIASVGGSGIKSKLVIRKSASKMTLNKSD